MGTEAHPAPREGGGGEEMRRALSAIRGLKARVAELEARAREPVAIVGMACRFPGGADTPEAYWTLLRDGVDATTDVPTDRWDVDAFYDADPEHPGTMYVRRGGFLTEPLDRFDAEFFGISPREAASMDPMQRMLLEMSWEGLERAGIAPHTLAGSSTGVFVGHAGSDFDALLKRHETVEDLHPYRGTGVAASVAAGRIAHVLGLAGPAVTVDAACSSSLLALALAMDHLRSGRCDLALAGGASLIMVPDPMVLLCRMRALSPDGRCKTFGADADGYGRGEGGGVMVLKRLSDARADGDPIHAVILGGAWNHDGRSAGLTVPNPAAQKAVVRAALDDAGLAPHEVGYVEAHGTGTPLGDPIELRALGEVLGHDRPAASPLRVGSVKTNFGHLEAAAGVAGAMKVALSLAHRALPRHLHADPPTPHVDWAGLPLRVATDAEPWGDGTFPRHAGVSAFGFSGTNVHLILGPAPVGPAPERPARNAELTIVSGATPEAVRTLAGRLADHLDQAGDAALGGVARTLASGRTHQPVRATVVGDDRAATVAGLRETAAAPDEALAVIRGDPDGRLAVLCTGQGAQYPGMARGLFEGSAHVRATLETCDEILAPHLDRRLLDLLLREDDPEVLRQTGYAQPALFAVEFAVARLWERWGVRPALVAGHSLGEYVAATLAGVFRLEDALPLVALRGRLMQELPGGGAMVAIEAPEADVQAAVGRRSGVSVAAVNGPASVVVSGDPDPVRDVAAEFEAAGTRCTALHVSHAFHSHRMDPILDRFEEAVRALPLSPPTIPVVSNRTGQVLTPGEATDPAHWRRHVRETVRFAATLDTLWASGARTFLEVGPHPTLSALGSNAIRDPGARWLPSLRRGAGDWHRLLSTLAALYEQGRAIDWDAYGKDHGAARTVAPTYPFARTRHWPDLRDAPAGGAEPRRVGPGPADRGTPSELVHAMAWVAAPAPTDAPSGEGDWLLVGVDRGTAAAVRRRLAAPDAGARVHVLDDAASLDAFLDGGPADAPLAGVVVAPAEPAPGSEPWARAMSVVLSVAGILQSGRLRPDGHVTLLTRGATGPDGASTPGAAAVSALTGLPAVIEAEYPRMRCRLVDVDPDRAADPDLLAACLVGGSGESRWALGRGACHVPRLRPRPAADAAGPEEAGRAEGAAVVHGGAAYLVTGATGGIGRAVVAWLASRGAGAVVATARSAPSGEAAALFDRLRHAGADVRFTAGDAADPDALEAALGVVDDTGLPLGGVFHVAGALDDGLLADLDADSLRRVFRPKVEAAWHLHERTRDRDLDHFVLFSSTAALLGGQGQGAYAAANAGLGALAEYRRTHGLPALAVEWGPWGEAGMAQRMGDAGRRLLERSGVRFLDTPVALGCLASVLGSGGADGARVVVADVDWPKLVEARGRGRVPLLDDLVPEGSAPTGPTGREAFDLPGLLALDDDQRRGRLERYLARAFADALGFPEGRIDPGTEAVALGLDSLMAVDVRNRIEVDLRTTVPAPRLMMGTVGGLAEELVSMLADATPPADADDAMVEGEI